MAEIAVEFDTGHMGAIHDCQLDYYGKKLATTSSDHTIKLWDISTHQSVLNNITNNDYSNYNNAANSSTPVHIAELKAHEGPVWQVSWAHPKFGGIIASCSYDKRVIIWREVRQNEWQIVHKNEDHTASVNTIAWASWEYGLQLACGSSDGYISILSYKPEANAWMKKTFQGHPNGVNAVSWCPPCGGVGGNAGGVGGGAGGIGGSGGVGGITPMGCGGAQKIVSGGCDNQLRIWKLDELSGEWVEINRLDDRGHTDWIRDVSWRPNVGLASNCIVSCSEDQTVIIWYQESDNMPWINMQIINMHAPVWRVSWSVTGNVLAVASGDSTVVLFKEGVDGKFESITNLGNNSNIIDDVTNNQNGNINKESDDTNTNICNTPPQQSNMMSPNVTVGGGGVGSSLGGSNNDIFNVTRGSVPLISAGGGLSPSRGSLGAGVIGGNGAVLPNQFVPSSFSNTGSSSLLLNGLNTNLPNQSISSGGASSSHLVQQTVGPYAGGGGRPLYRGAGNVDGSGPLRG